MIRILAKTQEFVSARSYFRIFTNVTAVILILEERVMRGFGLVVLILVRIAVLAVIKTVVHTMEYYGESDHF